MSILELVQNETGKSYQRKGTGGKEYAGPCPFCQAGEDRFILWPDRGRYWCRVCDRKGDAIQFVRDYKHLPFAQAKEYVQKDCCVGTIHNNDNNHNNDNHHNNHNNQPQTPPAQAWRDAAWPFVFTCQAHLMEHSTNPKARAWLHGRGLCDATLWQYGIGYNPQDHYAPRSAWGLVDVQGERPLWLPRGIVIPWVVEGELWGIRIRRPVGEPKYYWLPGGTPGLYNADALTANQPVLLLEGEIDALTVAQAAGDIVTPVATGSTHGARRTKWLARLATASVVLVAYDADEAGEKAAGYWVDALPNAKRWRPYWADPNDMVRDGVDVRGWVEAGLQWIRITN